MILDEKYVLHIPLSKYVNGELAAIEIDDLVDELISRLSENGYENLYILKARGYYSSRCFDEILITIYLSPDENHLLPDEIFLNWFETYNDILQQEAVGYEHNGRMFVEKISKNY